MIQSENQGFAMVGWTYSPTGESEILLVLVPPPLTPQEETGVIITEIEDLVDSGVLNNGLGVSLTKKLEAAINLINKGNLIAATKQLNAFIKQVNALVLSGNLSVEEGQRLIALAQEIIDALAEI